MIKVGCWRFWCEYLNKLTIHNRAFRRSPVLTNYGIFMASFGSCPLVVPMLFPINSLPTLSFSNKYEKVRKKSGMAQVKLLHIKNNYNPTFQHLQFFSNIRTNENAWIHFEERLKRDLLMRKLLVLMTSKDNNIYTKIPTIYTYQVKTNFK